MDIVTQGLLGACLAQSVANKNLRAATTVGFLAGLLPDVDTLIRSTSDPLLFLEFHRHFTHSLVFVPIGAGIAALLLWPFLKHRMRALELYGFALLGYALSGLLDACTSYGTYLYWPLSNEPVAWNIISIVDPLFSLALLAGVGLSFLRLKTRPARVGLVVAGCYLAFAAWQHEHVEEAAWVLAESRGHVPERVIVKPTIGNVILWRSLYVDDGLLYADGIRRVPLLGTMVYEGQVQPLLTLDTLKALHGRQFRIQDLERFDRFSDQFLVRHPQRRQLIGDARFAMLPTSLRPLWGIEPDTQSPTGAAFVTDRQLDPEQRQAFVRMLLGQTVEASSE